MKRHHRIQELIIQHKRPTWHYLLIFVVAVILSYLLGSWHANFKSGNWVKEKEQLSKQVEKQQNSLEISYQKMLETEKENEINKQTIEMLKVTNQNLQDSLNELQTDLSFYRRIIGPTAQAGAVGTSVSDLKWEGTPEKTRYRYKMVLIQSGTNHEWQEGAIQLVIMGTQDSKVAKFFVKKAETGNNGGLNYRFRYFQHLEGVVNLPEHFIPERVEVTLFPAKEGAKQFKETFAWKLEGNDYVEDQWKEKIT